VLLVDPWKLIQEVLPLDYLKDHQEHRKNKDNESNLYESSCEDIEQWFFRYLVFHLFSSQASAMFQQEAQRYRAPLAGTGAQSS